jgi:hypothetical protein
VPHSNFLSSAVEYEQLYGCSVSVAHFSMCISQKACSLEIMEMWPCLTSHYRPASVGIPSAVHVPYYKNRGKIGESVQSPCNLVNSPFVLVESSLAPCSLSLNHGGGEASKGGDNGRPAEERVFGGPPCLRVRLVEAW